MAYSTPQYPTQQSPTRFLDRQMSVYGIPGALPKPTSGTQTTQQQPQQTQPAVMPNGQPIVQQAPAAPAPTSPAPNAGSVNAEGVYTAGQAPQQTYQAQQISQFQAPQFQPMQNQQYGNIMQMLQSGGSLNPQVVAPMKGVNNDQAALLERQNMGILGSMLGSRGINPNSPGYAQMLKRQMMADTNSNILNTNRGVDIQAAGQNWQDMLQAGQMADQFQNSALDRAIGGYQTTLQGAGFNSDEQQRQLASQYQQFGAQQGMLGQQSDSLMNAIRNRLQSQQLSQQGSQFDRSFGLDQSKFDWSKTMDERQLAAQAGAQSAANSHWEDQMAFQYQQAQQQEFNDMLEYLMSGGT